MDMRTNGIRCLVGTLFLLGATGTTRAEPFLPLFEGQVYTAHQYDPSNPTGWTVLLEVMGSKVTLGSHDYLNVQSWNYYNSGQFEDQGYLRSTEQALYAYNPAGDDYVMLQKAPVGTRWSTPNQGGGSGYLYRVAEIVSIESVTVPYGTFDQAYKHRLYKCYDPSNLGLGKSPDWYEWVVPGVGVVREEDYWTDHPPGIEELTSIAVAPVCRFWSPVYSRHFYTISEGEKRKLITAYSSIWTYEKIAYYTLAVEGEPAAAPVYRFWSDALNAHFYTIRASERDKLIRDYPHIWTYEGAKFQAFPAGSQPAGASPVYRFWSNVLGCHFYTMSEAERDKLINQYPHIWTYESIAWYAYGV
jgi:hypothetical protein